MLASTQNVLHRFGQPIVVVTGFTGEGCGMGRQCATGSVLEGDGISISDVKTGAVEASHPQ
ncbi:MAG: hypothetical protein WAK26_20870 [Terracidiphilus sp.]